MLKYIEDINSDSTLFLHLMWQRRICWIKLRLWSLPTLSTSFLLMCLSKLSSFNNHVVGESEENTSGSKSENKIRSLHKNKKNAHISKRKKRKAEYSAIQTLYKKNRQAAYRKIFSTTNISPDLDKNTVFTFWGHLFTKTDFVKTPNYKMDDNFDLNVLPHEASLVTPEEVKLAKLPYASAAGPDGVSVAGMNKIPLRIR